MIDRVQEAIRKGQGVAVSPLAAAAGVSRATLYKAIQRGEVAVTKIGKRVTVPPHVAKKLLKLDEVAA